MMEVLLIAAMSRLMVEVLLIAAISRLMVEVLLVESNGSSAYRELKS